MEIASNNRDLACDTFGHLQMRNQHHRWPKVETRQGLAGIVDEFRPSLQPFEDLYRHIHSHPELGTQESQTASLVAQHLKHIDLDVEEGIGGYGVAGILRNGAGPVVLIRAELDALPVLE